MNIREVRRLIFSILFERELMPDMDINKRISETYIENEMSNSKKELLSSYIFDIIKYEKDLIEKIKLQLKGWSFENLGTTEKIILKLSFYEILIRKVGYQIAINEALELTKEYGDAKSKDFINGVLANIVD